MCDIPTECFNIIVCQNKKNIWPNKGTYHRTGWNGERERVYLSWIFWGVKWSECCGNPKSSIRFKLGCNLWGGVLFQCWHSSDTMAGNNDSLEIAKIKICLNKAIQNRAIGKSESVENEIKKEHEIHLKVTVTRTGWWTEIKIECFERKWFWE